MCGFAGIISKNNKVFLDDLLSMQRAIAHRGPDSNGIWINENKSVGFCHNRLAIVDVTDAGSQPMHSHNKRFVISFNGEIYNHLELRRELNLVNPACEFTSSSDTETLLGCFEYWGIEKTVAKIVGMFAFSVWDFEERNLYLVRDRMGEKPLYYGWQGDYFFFGSELKALKQHSKFISEVDISALSMYFRYSYIPSPYSIYKNIYKLPPGTILKVCTSGIMESQKYWDLLKVVEHGMDNSSSLSDFQAIEELDKILNNSIASQQLSDVPIGAFLSGGIDSSLITAIMQSQSSSRINTFTIGFKESKYNEANFAFEISKHLNTNHHQLYVSADDIVSSVPNIASIFDEPFSDSSQLPTYFVSKFAKQSVSVALSGDAGDEIFGGYNRYSQAKKFMGLSPILRKIIRSTLSQFSPSQIDFFYNYIEYLLPKSIRSSNAGNHYSKILAILSCNSEWEIYQNLVSICNSPELILNNIGNTGLNVHLQKVFNQNLLFENKMMFSDSVTYLPDDILCKVDRASMAVSLESRVPFLDYRLVEFAWHLPLNMKIRDGQGKWILRQLLNKYVPKHLIDRPKMGFGLPLDIWLRGPLRDYAESMLCDSEINEFLNPVLVNKLWLEHKSGKKNHQHILWSIIMFQSWKKKWL